MTKRQISERVAKKIGIPISHTENIFNSILHEIKEAVNEGESVNIRGIGIFKIIIKPPRRGFNIHTNELTEIPEKKVVKFNPSKQFLKK